MQYAVRVFPDASTSSICDILIVLCMTFLHGSHMVL